MIQAWVAQIHESLTRSRAEPSMPMHGRVVAVYAFCAVWVTVWWVFRPERNPQHHFFGEGES